jgi:hypothetical protein
MWLVEEFAFGFLGAALLWYLVKLPINLPGKGKNK